nr:ATP-binding protein [uncultured Methanobacterium sp.]
MEIEDIMKIDEGTKVEFKEEMNDSAYKTLAAFVNTKGGKLFLGISDDKKIRGVNCSEPFFRNLTDKIVNSIGTHPLINCLDLDGRKILVIDVKKGNLTSYRGKYYQRVGSTTRLMRDNDLKNLFLMKTNWDSMTGGYDLDNIDVKTVKRFFSMAEKSGRLKSAECTDDIQLTLEKLNLIIDGKLTNAGYILFSNYPQNHFTNAMVRLGRFKDDITIIGDRLIEGNLFNQVAEAEEAIKNFINVRYEITGEELMRKDVWDYPLPAIREILLNAIVHRNYHLHNMQTQIRVYDDHIWFHNAGGLPEGMCMDLLKNSHRSVARNPLISKIFYLSGLIEEYGTGIKRIMDSMKEANLVEPVFKEEMGGFSVYILKNVYDKSYFQEQGLNERQIRIMMYVMDKGSIRIEDCFKVSPAVGERTHQRDLNILIERQLLVKRGGSKNILYERSI